MKIAICDDQEIIRIRLREICEEYAAKNHNVIEISEYSCGQDLLTSEDIIDLLFLDIEMQDSNGIDVMNTLIKSEKVFRIVFVSSHDEMVMQVFGIKTLAFVKKPFNYDDISKWMDVVFDELGEDFIVELDVKDSPFIYASKIIYLESKGNYSDVITKHESYLTRRTLQKWSELLTKGHFLRIHKSYIVNMDYIAQINNDVILIDGSIFPIGRSYKKLILDEYNNYVIKKMRERR